MWGGPPWPAADPPGRLVSTSPQISTPEREIGKFDIRFQVTQPKSDG
jgi:hypothetical protein